MLANRVDMNELRSSKLFNKRYSLQRESSLELKKALQDIKEACGDGDSPSSDTSNNNATSTSGDGEKTEQKVEENAENGARSPKSGEREGITSVAPTFARSVSASVVLRSSAGLQPRPMSLNLMPNVIDIDATTDSVEAAANTSGVAEQQEPGVTLKKKRSKGILSAVSGMNPSKLKGKLEKMAASKLRRDGGKRDSMRSSTTDILGYISPRAESSPEGSPPVHSPLMSTSEPSRVSRSASGSPSSQLRWLASPADSSPLGTASRLSSSGDSVPTFASIDELGSPEVEVRRGKKLEKIFGDIPNIPSSINVPGNSTVNNTPIRPASPVASDEPIRKGKKLEKIFGDIPTNVYDRNTALEGEDDEEDVEPEEGVIYNPRKKKGTLPVIKGATMQKLVERMTHPSESDPNFLHQYLLTYRTFTTPQGLLDQLRARFEQVMEGKEETSAEYTPKNKQVIRLRLFNMLRSWLQHHWIDFQGEPDLVAEVIKFSEVVTREDMNMAAKNQLVKIVAKNTQGEQQKTLIFSQPPPKPYFPVAKDKLTLLDVHPEEFARQITLLEYDLYKTIKPWEFLTHAQGKKCANIINLINRFNDVNKWVQTEILRGGETPKQRAVVFGKLLEICEHLKSLNNYNALMEIVSGLNASPIFRLKLTWAAIGSKQVEAFRELETLVSSNGAYKTLRTALHTIKPPCIPYMGMYLTDLTFINDGNPQYLEQGYINFDKCRRLSAVIQEIIQYQQTPYCLKVVDEIQTYLKNLDFERDENKIYQLSLQLEERGSVRL